MKKLKKLLAAGAVIPALAFTLTACSGSAAAVSGIKDSKESVKAAGGETPDCCEGKDETKAAAGTADTKDASNEGASETVKAAGGETEDCCEGKNEKKEEHAESAGETKAAAQEGGDTHKAAGGDVKDCCSGE